METNLYPVYSWPPLYGPHAIWHYATIPAAGPANEPRGRKFVSVTRPSDHLPHLLPVSRRFDGHPLGLGPPCRSSKPCGSWITRPTTIYSCVKIHAPCAHHDWATKRESNWFVERCTFVVSRCGSGVGTPDADDGGRDRYVHGNCEKAAQACVRLHHCPVNLSLWPNQVEKII